MVALGITNVFAHGFPLFNLWHFPKFGSDELMRGVNVSLWCCFIPRPRFSIVI
jgi:hypothetical protein